MVGRHSRDEHTIAGTAYQQHLGLSHVYKCVLYTQSLPWEQLRATGPTHSSHWRAARCTCSALCPSLSHFPICLALTRKPHACLDCTSPTQKHLIQETPNQRKTCLHTRPLSPRHCCSPIASRPRRGILCGLARHLQKSSCTPFFSDAR